MPESAVAIDAAAADWVVRLDRGLTDAERDALEDWLSGDTRRRGALARAQAFWVHADRAQVFRAKSELQKPRAKGLRHGALPWVSAAAILVGVAIALWTWELHPRTLTTAVGEIRRVHLGDGSWLTLDTQSRVSIQYGSATRLVRLESGEASFEVVKDSRRPFVVEAGNVRVRAVGTAFAVRRRPVDGGVEVTVTRGSVDVWRETTGPGTVVRVMAGNQTLVMPNEVSAPEELTGVQLARAVGWTTEFIDLNGRTLGDAAAELNRYNHQTVVIADSRLAAQTVVGRFQVTDPQAFVYAAAAMLGAHVRIDGDRLILEPAARAKK